MDRTHCRGVFSFYVPGVPVGKGRPRFTKTGRTYTPAKTREWERQVATVAKHVRHGRIAAVHPMLEGPLRATLRFDMPPLKSWSRRRRHQMNGAPAVGRTDLDNYVKAVLDACNGIVFNDDRQVAQLRATKRYAISEGLAGVGVIVEELE